VFRRRSTNADLVDPGQAASDASDAEQAPRPRPGWTAPKGAPTPKRSEAQGSRRQPYQAPTDRKAASKVSRQRSQQDRIRRTEALQRGEEWALPAKDRGPVRALARDIVDSRRGFGEYYMVMVVVLLALLFLPGSDTKIIADFIVLALLLLIVAEGWFVGQKVKRLAAERFPGQTTRGVMMYTVMRGISMRRMRVPKPRVNRGDKV
jgi:Protein of unknown function (DUF3043)